LDIFSLNKVFKNCPNVKYGENFSINSTKLIIYYVIDTTSTIVHIYE